jgi:rhodanese-related sulfurtransferase
MANKSVKLVLAAIVLVLIAALAYWPGGMSGLTGRELNPSDPSVTLADIEEAVSRRYPVPELTAMELSEPSFLRDAVIFDVREREEYETSYIPNAIHVPPDLSADDFLAAYGPLLQGKKAVFYCAVGVRSAIMRNRVTEGAGRFSPQGLYNLRGGVFRWRANGGALMSERGPVSSVHPYDEAWGKLLARTLNGGGG